MYWCGQLLTSRAILPRLRKSVTYHHFVHVGDERQVDLAFHFPRKMQYSEQQRCDPGKMVELCLSSLSSLSFLLTLLPSSRWLSQSKFLHGYSWCFLSLSPLLLRSVCCHAFHLSYRAFNTPALGFTLVRRTGHSSFVWVWNRGVEHRAAGLRPAKRQQTSHHVWARCSRSLGRV